MAKDQQISLNPAKISGNCGRLLCCLRYEEELYQTIFKEFPPIDSTIVLKGEDGKDKQGVLSFINIFKNVGQVRFADGGDEWLSPEELSKGTIKHDK
jgi:cell fate regulator YaaT (PSP1 superfamily)